MAYRSGKIGNIRITKGDQNLHWWKMDSIYDEGLDDKDFYTFWYSVCYLFALLYRQGEEFLDITQNVDLVKRFLTFWGISFNRDTIDNDILFIYNEWVQEMNRRGTEQMFSIKSDVSGRCVKLKAFDASFSSFFLQELNIGNSYVIELDVKFDEGGTVGGNFFEASSSGGDLINFSDYSSTKAKVQFFDGSSEDINVLLDKSDSKVYHIKLVREITNLKVYVDDSLSINREGYLVSDEDILTAEYLFLYNSNPINYIKIANLSIISNNGVEYRFSLADKFYDVYDSNNQVYFVIDPSNRIEDIYVDDNDFNNINSSLISGEVSRLINRKAFDEFIFPLVRGTELSWNLDNSSPQSSQNYPIINFNKFYCKNESIYSLRNIPIYVGVVSGGEIAGISIEANFLTGVDAIKISNINSNPKGIGNGLNPLTEIYNNQDIAIPINEGIDYEISFRIRIDSPNTGFRIWFNVVSFDEDFAQIPPHSAISVGDTETYFLGGTVAASNALLRYIGKDVWVRGILYNSSKFVGVDVTKLNIDAADGRNLIMQSGTKYIVPNIIMVNPSDTGNVYIWDVQVRPLDLDVSKGSLGLTDVFLPYLVNNGDMNDGNVESFIRNNLIPYNSLLKVKYL